MKERGGGAERKKDAGIVVEPVGGGVNIRVGEALNGGPFRDLAAEHLVLFFVGTALGRSVWMAVINSGPAGGGGEAGTFHFRKSKELTAVVYRNGLENAAKMATALPFKGI